MLGKIALIILAVIFSEKPTLASPPVIVSSPQYIKVDSEFTITATMSGLKKNTVYRLRIALSKPDSHGYFGSTEGYNGTPSPIDYSKFKSITTDNEGSWNGEVKGKVENSDPNYKDKELKSFDLKLGRYTENGTSATWSEIVNINLENPNLPTPTPAPAQKPKPTPVKTESPAKVTQIPIITSAPTPKIEQIIQNNKTNESQPEEEIEIFENILATNTTNINKSLEESSKEKTPPSKSKYFFLASGISFSLLSALAFLKKKKDN